MMIPISYDMILAFFWLVIGLPCAWIALHMARNRGRSGKGWFFLGLFFGPLALAALAITGPKRSDLTA